MNKKLLLLAGAAAVVAVPAQAREGQPYIGVDAGFVLGTDIDMDLESPVEEDRAARIDRDDGYEIGVVAGYDFGAFRLEADLSYRENDSERLEIITPGLSNATGLPIALNQTDIGNADVFAAMINGLVEFGNDDGFTVFAGGGAGVAHVEVSAGNDTIGVPISDGDTGFAYQALAGARVAVTDNVDLGLKYRYFVAQDVGIDARNVTELEADYESHSILASLIYNFGAPTPPPPPAPVAPPPPRPAPAAPPPPPPPPAPACNTGPYIVFFDFDQSNITADAATILDSAVTAYSNCGTASVMLAGHTDRSGSVTYNQALAQRRNASVTQYLAGKGIPSGRISAQAFGESQNRVPTEDGVRELQNRRVEVTYGPGSGM
ncbi:flagellar motor protein MotB [Erythrobacter longus]|uniref:Flagellar motor protein MotB n=1 Tax=Erythrobacter longus TaxID=1044 RepID=A0A074M9X6_ERYLO|nr:outer membrane beta-barrel protein [Erythrobacter longus]KEO91596.1 flagellar motor protein MotB [Erythrobacter longus]